MIAINNTEVIGWEHAIRGMRNPLNSWDKSDSKFTSEGDNTGTDCPCWCPLDEPELGENDLDLMKRLAAAGTDHSKYRRMITVYLDITAPLYWWKEYDTYKVGTVANSCSTMHKIADKEFTLEDFSHEHLNEDSLKLLRCTIEVLNYNRGVFIGYVALADGSTPKDYWWQMIQLLPSSYNQRRTVQLNYEVLANMYHSRKAHKLDEWRDFCKWVESLPYSEIITGGERK